MKEIITTENAPAAVGTYSTAYKCGNMVFLSGQLGLDPVSGELPASFEAQCRQAFRNVFAIVKAAGGTPADIVRQTVYLTDLDNFGVVNKVMSEIFSAPYPARSCVQISALPKGGLIEVEATVVLYQGVPLGRSRLTISRILGSESEAGSAKVAGSTFFLRLTMSVGCPSVVNNRRASFK